jgi:beta-ureidopropionase / N-carbamoyl-L-amino-acid hydrolase
MKGGRAVLKINPDRLLDDLRRLRSFGATGPGVVRLALSPIDLASRHGAMKRALFPDSSAAAAS